MVADRDSKGARFAGQPSRRGANGQRDSFRSEKEAWAIGLTFSIPGAILAARLADSPLPCGHDRNRSQQRTGGFSFATARGLAPVRSAQLPGRTPPSCP